MRPHQIHTIKHDPDYVAKIKEAAARRVDLDTDVYRPEVLSRLNLKASASPSSQNKRSKSRGVASLPTTRHTNNTLTTPRSKNLNLSRDAARESAEKSRIQHGKNLILEAKAEETFQQERSNATPGEKKLATSIRKAQEILFGQYTKSLKKTRALESEQKEWRHQSPSKRTVDTSPTRSWSTKRGQNISKLAETAVNTRYPPVFKSSSLLRLSPYTSRSSTKNYGVIICSTPTKKRDPAVRNLGF